MCAENSEADIPFIRRYLARRLVHDGNIYKEGKAIKTAVDLYFPKIVTGTVSMMQMFVQVWEE